MAKMTTDEFSALRKKIGLSMNEAAAVLGISVDTMRIYEGKKKRSRNMGPHPIAVNFLKAIESDPDFVPPHWPARLLEGE